MKITEQEVVDRQTVLNIELEDEDLEQYLDRAYRRVVQRTLIPGFRKGKAPRLVVERFLGRESLLNEVLDTMLPEVTDRAISEQELDSAGIPSIEVLETDPFTMKAIVPLTPEIDLGSYGDIRITEEATEVTEEDVQGRLEQLRQSVATWEPVDRPAQLGDMVTMAVKGALEGRTVLEDDDAVFYLDEESSNPAPGFVQRLVGLSKDGSEEFDLALSEDHPDPETAGKEARFSVSISEIKERNLPEPDDDFAKSVGDGHASMEKLLEQIRGDLNAEAESAISQRNRESALKALLEGATVGLPSLIVEHEIEHMEGQRTRILGRANVRMDDYMRSVGKSEDDMKDEMRQEAVERLSRSFAVTRLSEVEGLEVSDEEVEERIKSMLSSSGEEANDRQVPDELAGSIRQMMLADKTLDRLVAIAKGEAQARSEPEPGPVAAPQPVVAEGEGADDKQA